MAKVSRDKIQTVPVNERQHCLAQVWVPGRPRTKGSLRATCTRDARHTIRYQQETKDSKAWQRHVATAVQTDMITRHGGILLLERAVTVQAVYFFRREDEDMSWEPYPTAITVGDLDKLERNVGDALTQSLLVADDKFIVQTTQMKFWGNTAGVQLHVLLADDPAEALGRAGYPA